MNDMAQLAARYHTATDVFIAAAAQVTDANIDVRHPDGWSARQIVHHMADSEAQSYARLRRLGEARRTSSNSRCGLLRRCSRLLARERRILRMRCAMALRWTCGSRWCVRSMVTPMPHCQWPRTSTTSLPIATGY